MKKFALGALIIFLTGLGLLWFLGNQTRNGNTNEKVQPFVTVSDLGLSIPIDPPIDDLVYFDVKTDGVREAKFTTADQQQALASADPSCQNGRFWHVYVYEAGSQELQSAQLAGFGEFIAFEDDSKVVQYVNVNSLQEAIEAYPACSAARNPSEAETTEFNAFVEALGKATVN